MQFNHPNMERRTFLKSSSLLLTPILMDFNLAAKPKLALSQWALHRTQFGTSKEDYQQWQAWLSTTPDKVLQGALDPLDFPETAKETYGFDAVEYVNTFFYRKDAAYFEELRKRSTNVGIKNLLIMVDEEGFLGDPDTIKRSLSLEKHKRWLEAAAILGCHSIRVNAHSIGTKEEQQLLAVDGLSNLCELAQPYNLDVIIENHGGMSSNPEWLLKTIELTGKSNIGTMVDFDNFNYSETKIWDGEQTYDRYKGVELLLPYAKSVSAKSYTFDANGVEETIDFERMAKLIKDAGYNGYVSVEYEGNKLTEKQGIKATKKLLNKVW